MKSRTNAQQELMRQQLIEEERHDQSKKYQTSSACPTSFRTERLSQRIPTSLAIDDKSVCGGRVIVNREAKQLPKAYYIESQISKRQRSSSYSVMSENCLTKTESFSPASKTPMDLAFSSLGNDDALDWNQIEPSITSPSEISQDLFDQMTRGRHETIAESYMETGTEENDSILDDQSVSSMKPSTSCPANITYPMLFSTGQTVTPNQHFKASQKPMPNLGSVGGGVVEDQKMQWMRDRNKKDCHNRIERKRRDYINNQIQELGLLLPEKLFLSTESKRNKGGILKNSVIYIHQLQEIVDCLQHLQKENQMSANIISIFFERLQYLEGLLSQNGVPFEQSGNDKPGLQEWFNVRQKNSDLLENINSIRSSWAVDHDSGEKGPDYGNSQEEVTVRSEDKKAGNLSSVAPVTRTQSSSNGVSRSGSQTLANYHSPLHSNTSFSSASNNGSRPRVTPSNTNVATVHSPERLHSQVYGSSTPFSKTGIRLFEQTPTRSFTSDSPVLSSILIGSAANSSQNVPGRASGHRQTLLTGLSNSVPGDSRSGFLAQSVSIDHSSGERYYLIPISKTKGIQLVGHDFKNSRGVIKVDINSLNAEDPVLSLIDPGAPDSPPQRVSGRPSFSFIEDEEAPQLLDISPGRDDIDDSLMDEFDLDDVRMQQ